MWKTDQWCSLKLGKSQPEGRPSYPLNAGPEGWDLLSSVNTSDLFFSHTTAQNNYVVSLQPTLRGMEFSASPKDVKQNKNQESQVILVPKYSFCSKKTPTFHSQIKKLQRFEILKRYSTLQGSKSKTQKSPNNLECWRHRLSHVAYPV